MASRWPRRKKPPAPDADRCWGFRRSRAGSAGPVEVRAGHAGRGVQPGHDDAGAGDFRDPLERDVHLLDAVVAVAGVVAGVTETVERLVVAAVAGPQDQAAVLLRLGNAEPGPLAVRRELERPLA